ncbi:RecB family exonuclease [Nocardia rhizosphaerihabitans]|uniref:RecB family exonuclease n=1 Tax=Nocardia rhizosphaerihabitans TaxID=1691570 RepID=UPI00367017DB
MGSKRSLSVSQYKTYRDCPQQWYLIKVAGAWQRPAAWFVQGSAFHAAAEAREKSGRTLTLEEMEDVYKKSFVEEVKKYTHGTEEKKFADATPNLSWWFASGPYGGEADLERRFGIGLAQVAKYPAWYEKHPEEVIWTAPDGTPGVELPFDIDLDGVRVRGYIDALIMNTKTGRKTVRDNKTGKSPGDEFQLEVYKIAEEIQHGEEFTHGDYWMAVSGKPTIPYDLRETTRERITEQFHWLAEQIEAERFDPDPEPSKCNFCGVASACPIFLH